MAVVAVDDQIITARATEAPFLHHFWLQSLAHTDTVANIAHMAHITHIADTVDMGMASIQQLLLVQHLVVSIHFETKPICVENKSWR